MSHFERQALVVFMRQVLMQAHPHIEEYPLTEIERIYEAEGEESEKLNDMPAYALHAFYMQRAIEVIEQKRRFV